MKCDNRRRTFKGLVMLKNNRGYTLPELIIVMAIFIVVMMVTSQGFKTILTQVGQQSKLMETDIGSVVGLELLRSDLQNAGYGLPWAFQADPLSTKYVEVAESDNVAPNMPFSATFWETGTTPRTYNDAGLGVPRAVQSGNTTFNKDDADIGSKYLVLKSLSVSAGDTPKKWVSATYDQAGKTQSSWNTAERSFDTAADATERVIVVRNVFTDGIPTRQLQVSPGGVFASTFKNYTTLAQPHSSGDVFLVYGVDAATDLRMPFNRADYYVRRPSPPPPACAPNTGVLYKAVLNHTSGFTEIPLLDCVADMQVVYGFGPVKSTEVNQHETTLPGSGTAQDIREQLKEIRLYILAQTGRKDTGYTHPNSTITVGESFSGSLKGRNFDLADLIGPGWSNYRWKVYTIVVRPQNLIQ